MEKLKFFIELHITKPQPQIERREIPTGWKEDSEDKKGRKSLHRGCGKFYLEIFQDTTGQSR